MLRSISLSRVCLFACLVGGLLVASACSETEDDDDGGDGAITYSGDIQPIWDGNCSCHLSGGAASDTLNLGTSSAAIVNASASGMSDMNLVEPGDPDASYLWHKLNGTQSAAGGSGDIMPPDGGLNSTQLTKIETWITDGAG